jgi:hypothetical protein
LSRKPDARHLVGERDGHDLEGPTCQQRGQPRQRLLAVAGMAQDSGSAIYKERSFGK